MTSALKTVSEEPSCQWILEGALSPNETLAIQVKMSIGFDTESGSSELEEPKVLAKNAERCRGSRCNTLLKKHIRAS